MISSLSGVSVAIRLMSTIGSAVRCRSMWTFRRVGVLAVLVGCFCLAKVVSAQTTPTVTWTAPAELSTVIEAQAFTWNLYWTPRASTTTSTAVLAGVTCSGSAPFSCTAPVPAGVPLTYDAKFELTAKSPSGAESDRSVPFLVPTRAPTALGVKR